MASFNGVLHTLTHHPHGRALNFFTYIREGGVSLVLSNWCRRQAGVQLPHAARRSRSFFKGSKLCPILCGALGMRKLL